MNPRTPQRSTILVACFLGILAVMLVPLPAMLLDALLCLNITASLLIVMSVMGAARPTEIGRAHV